jgi:prepilin-type N-terminal cleavage/methylation domain-containing protein
MMTSSHPTRTRVAEHRGGFTLIELLTVVAVIVILMALAFPVIGSIRASSDRSATFTLVSTLTAAAAAYRDLQVVPVTVGSRTELRRPWDIDQDGAIDGDPTLGWAASGSNTPPAWYRGPIAMLGLTLPKWASNSAGVMMDRWQQPIRVFWSADKAGSGGLAAYSIGLDGTDQTRPTEQADADDIRSWEQP